MRQDSATAKKLAFAREVGTRCVTLEGDDFNPGGTLTGGSRNNSGKLLARLHELAEAEAQLAAAQAAAAQALGTIQATATAAAQYKKCDGMRPDCRLAWPGDACTAVRVCTQLLRSCMTQRTGCSTSR